MLRRDFDTDAMPAHVLGNTRKIVSPKQRLRQRQGKDEARRVVRQSPKRFAAIAEVEVCSYFHVSRALCVGAVRLACALPAAAVSSFGKDMGRRREA